jgi:hypothetical protein
MYRPAWRISHIGVTSDGWRRQDFRKGDDASSPETPAFRATGGLDIASDMQTPFSFGLAHPFNKLPGPAAVRRAGDPRNAAAPLGCLLNS